MELHRTPQDTPLRAALLSNKTRIDAAHRLEPKMFVRCFLQIFPWHFFKQLCSKSYLGLHVQCLLSGSFSFKPALKSRWCGLDENGTSPTCAGQSRKIQSCFHWIAALSEKVIAERFSDYIICPHNGYGWLYRIFCVGPVLRKAGNNVISGLLFFRQVTFLFPFIGVGNLTPARQRNKLRGGAGAGDCARQLPGWCGAGHWRTGLRGNGRHDADRLITPVHGQRDDRILKSRGHTAAGNIWAGDHAPQICNQGSVAVLPAELVIDERYRHRHIGNIEAAVRGIRSHDRVAAGLDGQYPTHAVGRNLEWSDKVAWRNVITRILQCGASPRGKRAGQGPAKCIERNGLHHVYRCRSGAHARSARAAELIVCLIKARLRNNRYPICSRAWRADVAALALPGHAKGEQCGDENADKAHGRLFAKIKPQR